MTTEAEITREAGVAVGNPFVGPRALRRGELLPARDVEKNELANVLIAERIVLLHAPSGAGKTSLVQAGLIPRLDTQGFRPAPPVRVNTPPPEGLTVRNRYVFSVALDLLGKQRKPAELAELTLADIVADYQAREGGEGFLVLIFDQFEEIVSTDPIDWENQIAFFSDLAGVLADGRIWTLFSIREDLMGGLDRFRRYVPGHLRTTYRLDFLDRRAARLAIQLPAKSKGVSVSDDVADELVSRLAKVKVARPCEGPKEVDAPYVQPFNLQVVCRRLWKSVAKQKGEGFRSIDHLDVENIDIAGSFRKYYAGTVAEVAVATHIPERAIRDWFENDLITAQRLRTQTVTGPAAAELDPTDALAALEAGYLIRRDDRAGTSWYELAHDMLVDPILEDNRKWRRRRLEPWQLAAREWRVDRQEGRLLRGAELHDANKRAKNADFEQFEREFLEKSDEHERARGFRRRLQWLAFVAGYIAIIEAIVILVFIVLFVQRVA